MGTAYANKSKPAVGELVLYYDILQENLTNKLGNFDTTR